MCKVWVWQKPMTTAIVSNRAHLSPQLSCFWHLQAQNVIITSLKPLVGSPSDRKYRVSSNLWCIPSLVSKGVSVLRSLGHFPYFYTKTELENINAMKAAYLWAGDAQARLSESLSFLYINSLSMGRFFCIRSQKYVAQLSIHSPSVSASRINSSLLEK